jgi:sporulation integral membrane protein YlbJ
MGIFINEKSKVIAAGVAIIICIMMILFADTAVMSAKEGISLWVSSILPALFPFFICVNFLMETGVVRLLPENIFPFAMSVLAGYPVGVKIVGDMLRDGIITDREAHRMVSYCSTSGPGFIIGAVGTEMLCSQMSGIIIAVSHYAGAVLNGLLFSMAIPAEKTHAACENNKIQHGIMDTVTLSIYNACKSMAVILACIMMFMFAIDLLETSGLFDLIDSGPAKCILQGALEMTVGCNAAANADLSPLCACVIASVIISWGGLSVLTQSMSMLSGTGITVLYFMITKISHSFFAGIIALFIGKFML